MRPKISVVLIVRDERDRLPAALATVGWADEVLVADTGSTDGTQELARGAGARVEELPWEGYVATRNRALALAVNDWVFFVDADERVTEELRDEMLFRLVADGETLAGLRMPRLSRFLGREVRHGAWYPDVQFRAGRRSRSYRAVGGRVHETYLADGPVVRLKGHLLHDPYRDLSDYLRKAAVYARLAAEDRAETGERPGPASILLRPPFEFLRSYVLKAGFLDGSAGAQVAFVHAWYYVLRVAYLREIRQRPGASEALRPEATS